MAAFTPISPSMIHCFGLFLLLAVGPQPGQGLPPTSILAMQVKASGVPHADGGLPPSKIIAMEVKATGVQGDGHRKQETPPSTIIAMEVKASGVPNDGEDGDDDVGDDKSIPIRKVQAPAISQSPGAMTGELDVLDLCGQTCQETFLALSTNFYFPCKAVYVPPCRTKPQGYMDGMKLGDLCPSTCPPEVAVTVPQSVHVEKVRETAPEPPLLSVSIAVRLPIIILSALIVLAFRYLPAMAGKRKEWSDKLDVWNGKASAQEKDIASAKDEADSDEDDDDAFDTAIKAVAMDDAVSDADSDDPHDVAMPSQSLHRALIH